MLTDAWRHCQLQSEALSWSSDYRSIVLERLIGSRSDSRDSLPVRCSSSLRLLRSLGARLIKRLTKLRLAFAFVGS